MKTEYALPNIWEARELSAGRRWVGTFGSSSSTWSGSGSEAVELTSGATSFWVRSRWCGELFQDRDALQVLPQAVDPQG